MRGLLGMGRKAHGRVNNWQQQWVRAAVQQMPRRRFQQTSKLAARSVPHRKELHKAQLGMSRTGLRLATATPALAALRLAHEHTRAEHARHARTTRTRASLASDAHMHVHSNMRSRQKARCSAHWPLADRRPACRWHIWREHALQSRSPPPVLARHMHHPHDVPAINHRLIV